MLFKRNSVVKLDRICLTPLAILNSLAPIKGRLKMDLRSRVAGLWWGLAGVAVLMGACATADTRPAPEAVKERAQARANAVVSGDTQAVYGFFTPRTRRELKYEDYASGARRGFWKAATVDKVECSGNDQCNASLTIEYEYKGMHVKTPLRESWIREGNEWWYAVKD
jgi:hypothetical protein